MIRLIDYLSLFSGIGGFECGIQQSNKSEMLNCINYSEIDKYAKSIYRRHFPNHTNLGDVREIRTEELPNFDLLIGGFPCQSFSNSGNKRGFDDTRGTLFFEIARILKDKRPKYFLLENVRGLLSNNKGETYKRILEIFAKMGYDVEWEMYNSQEFVPQRRERIFIKGYFRERCGNEIFLNTRTDGCFNEKRKNNVVKDKPYLPIRETTKKGYKEAYPNDGVLLNRGNRKIAKGIVRREHCGCLQTGGIWGTVTEDYHIRKLTPVECERLQGFVDNYTKYGADGELISDSQRYKCLGNAVTVPVIKNIFDNWELKV